MPDSVIILGTPVHALTRDAVVARCTEFLDTNRVPASGRRARVGGNRVPASGPEGLGVGGNRVVPSFVPPSAGRVGGQRLHQIVTANPEFLLAARRDPAVRQVAEQGSLIVPDGIGLLWAARRLGSRLPERVPGVDLLVDLCRMAARRSVPVFFLGGRGVAEAAAVSIRSRVPGLQVTAFLMDHEAFAPPGELWRELSRARPALLFVAYGAPQQEQWVHRHQGRLAALGVRIAMGVGGAFDILAGKFPRAPRWTRAAGLEWLWRLFLQPQRVSRIFRAVVLFPLAVLRDQPASGAVIVSLKNKHPAFAEGIWPTTGRTLYPTVVSVRVRLAPSPTGPLHVGTARTALFNFLFARRHDGKFLLRIEDTDRARSHPAFETEILEGLRWLGLSWDEGPDTGGPHAPYRQSERTSRYRSAIERLLQEGKAVEVDGAVLLRVEHQELRVSDLVRGEVRFPASEQRDFVIARSRDDPLFHLAVVVDDADMGITHVIRGEDHLSNTPRHILLQRALGLPEPVYAHLPLLLDQQRKKLSKRTAETGLLAYRDDGVLPEAMVNFLALLGWNPKTATEVLTIEDLVEQFDLAGIQKGGAVYARERLDWFQREHLRRLPLGTLAERSVPFLARANVQLPSVLRERALDIWRERGGLLSALPEAVRFYAEDPAYSPDEIPWRGTTAEQARDALTFAAGVFQRMPSEVWEDRQAVHAELLKAVSAAQRDRGTVLWPVRYALSGRRESPGPAEIAWALQKEETLRRIAEAGNALA